MSELDRHKRHGWECRNTDWVVPLDVAQRWLCERDAARNELEVLRDKTLDALQKVIADRDELRRRCTPVLP